MERTLEELARLADGQVSGDAAAIIKGVAHFAEAKAGDLCFVLDARHLAEALKSAASALVVSKKLKVEGKPAILVKDPRLAMAKLLSLFDSRPAQAPGIHKTAIIEKGSTIGEGSSVGPFVYIGEEVEIGKACVIEPHVTIYAKVKIGNGVVLHSGCRIGTDGFGFAQDEGKFLKTSQIGTVIIEDEVEVYCNSCIARGTIGATVIGAGTKIDNLSHIAHNCRIGKHCAITSLVGLAGSVTFGDHVSVGGQAGFNGHITVGENTLVMGKAGVTKDIPANSVISGFPAQDHRKELEQLAALRRLPSILKKKNK